MYTPPEERQGRLTERDYEEVAGELGVEVASIKAVVEIEAGKAHQGFWSEGKPVINFDLAVFRRMARRNNVSLGKYSRSHKVVFARPDAKRYGSQQAAQQARLDAAMEIDSLTAIQGTFWGMFQIGGFNWKKCGAASPEEFVRLMSRSERDQLELFAEFIVNSGLLPALKSRNWSKFAYGYNGPGYASRG
ncbi:MAG: N-acetylmuramidase family protein, partial [Muribaculaceae bacterium]|nr:N-acetylmuramidase family protein [Muribaculaceae bacterium]